MKRPEFELKSLPKTPLTGLAWEGLAPHGVRSVYQPLMGSGSSLYEFKRLGIRVLGSEWLKGAFSRSKALIENNSLHLTDVQMSRFTPEQAPNLAHHPRFAAWVERGFFDEKQAAWLGFWRDQLDALPAPASELILLAVSWVMNNWLDRAETGQTPLLGGTAVSLFMKRVNQWIWDNQQENLLWLGDSVDHARTVDADACYLYLPRPRVAIEMRDWLLEAWWQGSSVADLKAFYDENPFYGTTEDYQAAVIALFDHLEPIPLWVVQYRRDELDPLWGSPPAWLANRGRIAHPHPSVGEGGSEECLLFVARDPQA